MLRMMPSMSSGSGLPVQRYTADSSVRSYAAWHACASIRRGGRGVSGREE